MTYELPAEVNFANLVQLREQGTQHIDRVDVAEFDLSGLESAGSAVVALLIAWFRYGHAHGKVVRFLRVPAAIMNIIEVSNLAEVLPIAAADAGQANAAADAAKKMEPV